MSSNPVQVYAQATPIFLITLGILSVIDLGLGAKQAVWLINQPVDAYYIRHYGQGPTTARIVFYAISLPLASIIHTTIDGAVYTYVKDFRRVVTSLVGAVFLLVGWICQMAFWTNCEQISGDDSGLQDFCPQWASRKVATSLRTLESGTQTAKYAFGWVITVGYFAYMTFVAVTVSKVNKAKKLAAATTVSKVDPEASYEMGVGTK